MTETIVTSAVKAHQDEGIGSISDGNEDWHSAAMASTLSQWMGGSYRFDSNGLQLSNLDATNDVIDATAGSAFLEIDTSTWNVDVQSTYGGSSSPAYDTTFPSGTNTCVLVVIPSTVTINLQTDSSANVHLAYAVDGSVTNVSAGDVYFWHGTAPTHPSIQIGTADSSSTATFSNTTNETATPSNGSLELDSYNTADTSTDPSANGEIRRNGTDVKAYTGGTVRNLTSVLEDGDNFDGQGTSDFSNLNSVSTDSILNDIGNEKIQAAFDGLLVPVGAGLGMSDAIDPSNTTTPLQDAADAINPGDDSNYGTVLLPPTAIDEEATFRPRRGVSIIGWGRQASQISFTSSGSSTDHGFHCQSGTDGSFASYDGFQIVGPGDGVVTGHGWFIENNFARFHIGAVTIQNWGYQGWKVTGSTTSGRIDFMKLFGIDPSNAGTTSDAVFESSGGPGISIGSLYIRPSTGSGNIRPLQISSGSHHIQAINIGGESAGMIFSGGDLVIGYINYEPAVQAPEGYAVNAWATNDDDYLKIQSFDVNGANANDIDHVFRLNGFKHAYLPKPIGSNGGDWDVNVVDVTGTSQGGVYEGPSSDVDNNSGGTISPGLSCLQDLTIFT